jgi:hypothetical protein
MRRGSDIFVIIMAQAPSRTCAGTRVAGGCQGGQYPEQGPLVARPWPWIRRNLLTTHATAGQLACVSSGSRPAWSHRTTSPARQFQILRTAGGKGTKATGATTGKRYERAPESGGSSGGRPSRQRPRQHQHHLQRFAATRTDSQPGSGVAWARRA